jgi:hypothetical protein
MFTFSRAFAVCMEKRCFYSIFPKMPNVLRKFIQNCTIVFLTDKLLQSAECSWNFPKFSIFFCTFSNFFPLFTEKTNNPSIIKLLGPHALYLVVLATYWTDLHQTNLEVRSICTRNVICQLLVVLTFRMQSRSSKRRYFSPIWLFFDIFQ